MLPQSPTRLFLVVAFSLNVLMSDAQGTRKDTARTTVDLTHFRASNKVVKVKYGKVIMYFDQKDYLGKTIPADTVRVTPKYPEYGVIVELLKKGKAVVISRRDSTVAPSIVHYLERVLSTGYRTFELPNGTSFFSKPEFHSMYFWLE